MELQVNLGDPVEVTVLHKFIGYLFKSDQNEMVLCGAKDFDASKLIRLQKDDVVKVIHFTIPDAPQETAQDDKAQQADELGKLIQFPPKNKLN